MSLYRIQILDDRGKPVRLHRLLTDPIFSIMVRDEQMRTTLRQARAILGEEAGVKAWGIGGNILLAAVPGIAVISLQRFAVTSSLAPAVIVSAVAVLLMYIVAPEFCRAGVRRRRESLVRIFVAGSRCLCCANALTGLPLAEDGCVVCPECGAAWLGNPASTTSPAA